MAEKELIDAMEERLIDKIAELGKAIDGRFNRLKEVVIDYVSLGSDMMRGSVIAALKNV